MIIIARIRRDAPSIRMISIMPQRVVVAIRPHHIHLIIMIMGVTSKKVLTMTSTMGHLLLPRLHMDTRPIHDNIPDIPIIGLSIRRRLPIIIQCRHSDHPALEVDGGGISTQSTRRLPTCPTLLALQRRASIIIHQLSHNFLKFVVLPLQLGWAAGIHRLGAGPWRMTTH
jgi:hypothetical protein